MSPSGLTQDSNPVVRSSIRPGDLINNLDLNRTGLSELYPPFSGFFCIIFHVLILICGLFVVALHVTSLIVSLLVWDDDGFPFDKHGFPVKEDGQTTLS